MSIILEKIGWENLPSRRTPVNKTNLEKMEDNVQDVIDQIEEDLDANTQARHTHSNKSVLDNTTASYTTAEKTKLGGIEAQANKTTVDTELDDESTNPVQNKVIYASQEEQNTKIAELQQENEYLAKNQLYDTVKGNNVTLEGVAEGNRNSIDVFGYCEQKSYSGKNKYSGGDISATQVKSITIDTIPAGTYSLSAIAISSDTDSNACLVYDLTNNVSLGILRRNSRAAFGFSTDKPISRISFYASTTYFSGEGDSFSFTDIQIEEGSTATEYEPYVGCQASPNINYSQEIKRLSADRRNLYNYDGIYNNSAQSSISIVDDELIITRVTAGVGIYVGYNLSGLEIGKKYTIRSDTEVYIYKDRVYGEVYTNSSDASKGFTFVANQESYVIALIIGSRDIPNVGDQRNCGKVSINKGSSVLNYEPYQENPGVLEFKIIGRNIHSSSIKQGLWAAANGAYVSSSVYVCSTDPISVRSGAAIGVSNKNKKTGVYYIIELDKNKNFIRSQTSINVVEDYEFILGENTKYILVDLGSSASACTVDNVEAFQVEYGEVTEFEEYQEQTHQLTLSEDQELCAIKTTDSSLANYVDENGQMWIADQLAEDGIHKRVAIDVYDGSDDENWIAYTSSGIFQYVYYRQFNNSKIGWDMSLCSHFSNVHYAWNEGTGKVGYYSDHPNVARKYFCSDKATLEEWKTWVQENPIELAYVLEEEIIIPYTEEQAEQYAALQKVYMSKGVNNIYCTNDMAKNMETTYIQSTQYAIDSILNRVTALEEGVQ